jgi:hypothetical protein
MGVRQYRRCEDDIMKHLTTLVTEEAAMGAKKVLKLLHEVPADIRIFDTQGSVGNVYELFIGDNEDMGLCALCVESYVIGRQDGFVGASNLFGEDAANQLDAMQADIQADVDHHEASPWH